MFAAIDFTLMPCWYIAVACAVAERRTESEAVVDEVDASELFANVCAAVVD